MADPRSTGPVARGMGVWPIVIAAAVVIALAVWFFMGVDVQEPVPTPDSPAATGTAGEPSGTTGGTPDDTVGAPDDTVGQPSGTTGAGTEPGAPAGVDAPAGTPVVEPNPDLAPGTGTDTTRGDGN